MSTTRRTTYIAGPMRGQVLFNFPAFDAARDKLIGAGFHPVSPADIDRNCGFDPGSLPREYDWNLMPSELDLNSIITRDIYALRKCDSYVLLDGWEKSVGARAEKGLLDWQGAVRYDLATLKPCVDSSLHPEGKPTNPKDAIGSDKLPLHLWPATATATGCLAMLDGALKYGRSNFRAIGVRASIYADACARHVIRWFEGQDDDPDSGLPHLSHALACLAIIVDAKACGKLNDDRMYVGGFETLISDLTPHVKRLKEKYKESSPKHWTIKG